MAKMLSISKEERQSELYCLSCRTRWIKTFPIDMLLRDLICPYCGAIYAIIDTGEWSLNIEKIVENDKGE